MQGLTNGRIVHAVITDKEGALVHRPAIIVQVWNQETGCSNLQVFTDGLNDGKEYESGLFWATSYVFSEEPKPMTWHWIERA